MQFFQSACHIYDEKRNLKFKWTILAQPAAWRMYDSKLTPYEIEEGDGDPVTRYGMFYI